MWNRWMNCWHGTQLEQPDKPPSRKNNRESPDKDESIKVKLTATKGKKSENFTPPPPQKKKPMQEENLNK